MRNTVLALAASGAIALSGCTTNQAILGGAAGGAAIGAVATHTVGGAIVGAGIGALAGAILVSHHNNGWCTYRYHGKVYTDRCR
jgi:hypothetical protein